ncbi:sigma-70 family RNA polymerase sigma factor [Azomonas macrocytogenes]|uniref:RNA polymerase sigma-70 factor (ECF subfamily) n=1 Tax=Azomonas macrocytogenes TaxID=69962 RepID=A0A839T5S5_AZOMA|nr:sigma-70 family RNA polymerase sigma factor [Azomonas macrocytogenes]MBB3104772.1 RNA polymerase sigma-70 factor (ECF subfamily) [Azomonas macrocytogenes]
MLSSDITVQQAVSDLYQQHNDWLKSWLRKRLDCSDSAADLAQDTFMRLLVSRKVSDLQEPRAYLSSIARGLLIDRYRRRALEQAYLESLETLPEPLDISPEARALIMETLTELDAMFDRFSERTRTIFFMAQLDGLSHVEIGRQLGVSTNTVRKHLVQALTQCLLLMED